MAERDRDESGRPRNARPRDALGRLLPPGSEGVPRIPDDLELSPSESLAYAQDLLNQGLAFNAHEVLEAAWKNRPDDENRCGKAWPSSQSESPTFSAATATVRPFCFGAGPVTLARWIIRRRTS